MKTVSEVRHHNFLFLFELFKNQVWASWPDEPERGMLRKMAKTFSMSEKYLSHVKVGRKPIGHGTARNLESHFGLAVGWMDADHTGATPQSKAEDEFVASALMLFRLAPAAARQEMLEVMRKRLQSQNNDNESPAAPTARKRTRPGTGRASRNTG